MADAWTHRRDHSHTGRDFSQARGDAQGNPDAGITQGTLPSGLADFRGFR